MWLRISLICLALIASFAVGQAPAPTLAVPSAPGSVQDNAIFTKSLTPADATKGPPKLWTGAWEFGLNGSEGNTQILKIRTGGEARRETADNIFTMNGFYGLSRQMGILNEDKAIFNARDEILFGPNNPWSIFGALQIEYDAFRAYEFRVGLYTGVGYMFIKDDTTLLQGRVGAGAQREIGSNGLASRWVPEALIGWDFNHKFTDRQSFVSGVDIFPSLANAGQFRVRARAAYEIVIDPQSGTTIRFGIQDRYDSNPGSSPTGLSIKKNDLDYFTTLLFRF
jgi:putative salt-induced outer membrane protein YdiY